MGAYTGPVTELLGVYSGRISPESDIGIVWRTVLVKEILAVRMGPPSWSLRCSAQYRLEGVVQALFAM